MDAEGWDKLGLLAKMVFLERLFAAFIVLQSEASMTRQKLIENKYQKRKEKMRRFYLKNQERLKIYYKGKYHERKQTKNTSR